MIERTTYDSLEWLGEIGGLFDAIKLIGAAIAYPVASFALSAELVSHGFGDRIGRKNLFGQFKLLLSDKKYRKLLGKMESLTEKNLDLMRYIKKSRMLSLSRLSLLNVKQRIFIDKLGDTFTTHDEQDLDGDVTQTQSMMQRKADCALMAKEFAKSQDKVDQRLSKLYQIYSN